MSLDWILHSQLSFFPNATILDIAEVTILVHLDTAVLVSWFICAHYPVPLGVDGDVGCPFGVWSECQVRTSFYRCIPMPCSCEKVDHILIMARSVFNKNSCHEKQTTPVPQWLIDWDALKNWPYFGDQFLKFYSNNHQNVWNTRRLRCKWSL